jgi:DNA processing protein
MIADGVAQLVTNSDDVIRLAEPDGDVTIGSATAPTRRTDNLDRTQQQVYDAVPARGSSTIGEIAFASGLNVREVRSALAVLEAQGLLSTDGSGWSLAKRR